MAINPYGLYQYDEAPEQPQGDKAATSESFQPTISKEQLTSLTKAYKKTPNLFDEQSKDKLRKHAIYYNVPFYEGDFSITDALKQFGGGFIEGFTTLSPIDHPDNEYEAIARNVGHLLGFAPNMLAKPLKLLGLSRAANAIGGVRSIPLGIGEFATKKAAKVINPVLKTALDGRASASGTVTKFLTGGATKSVVEEGFKLGVASAVSNWKQGIDGMLEAGVGGAKFGAAFGALGNIVPGKGAGDYALRAVAGSLYQGLHATQRGATTPEQVYEYLLGAYFGGGATGWKQKGVQEFMVRKEKQAYGTEGKKADIKLRVTNDPEMVKGWKNLDPEVQKEIIKEMNNPKSIHYDPPGDAEARLALHEYVAHKMGIEPGKTTLSKKGWEEYGKILDKEGTEQKQIGLAAQTEKDLSDIFKERSEIVDKLQTERLRVDNLTGSERIIANKNIEEMESRLNRLQEKETRLLELEPYQFIDKETDKIVTEEFRNDGNDIGMVSNRDLLKKSEKIVSEKLKEVWDKESYSPATKRNELIRLTNVIDNIVRQEKYSKRGQKVDSEALVKEIEDTIKSTEKVTIKVDEGIKNDLRQWLTRKNFGEPVKYLNIRTTKDGVIDKEVELRKSDGFTFAGNRKQSIEPKKEIQKVLEELAGEGIDSHVILDNITTRGSKGEFLDMELSKFRQKVSEKKYNSFIKDTHKKMAEKDYYPYGGKGDNDTIIYIKKHPDMAKGESRTYIRQYLDNFLKKKNFKRYHNQALKRNKYFNSTEAREQYISNIMWDLSLNGFRPKTKAEYDVALTKLFEGEGYIKNATAWNKRNQIWFTPTWNADKEFVSNSYRDYLKTLKVKDLDTIAPEYSDAILKGNVRYIIARDLDPKLFKLVEGKLKRIKKLNKDSKNTEFSENVDGMTIVEDNYLNTLIKDSGLPQSGQSKNFIVSPDGEMGALLGKHMMHSAGKVASRQMRKAGIQMIMQESAVKQRGERQITDYNIKKGKVEIEDPKLIYEMPVEHIKYSYNVKQSNEMAGYTDPKNPFGTRHKHGIPKQLLMAMGQNTFKSFPQKMIEDFFNETIYNKFKGEKKYNDILIEYNENPKSKTLLNILEKNIDKLGMNELLSIINGPPTPLADAAYFRLMKLNKDAISSRVAEGEISPDEAEKVLENMQEFNSATDRMVSAAQEWSTREKMVGREGNINTLLLHKYIRPYRFQVIRNYVFQSISKPKIGNSGVARMRGYDKWFRNDPKFKELETNDEVFYLDNSFKKMPLKTHIPGYENITLERLWNNYNNKKHKLYQDKDVKKVLRALTVRVPMDSVSGAQAMDFGGFTGRNGHGILMHSRAMRAEGGADLDGDEAFVFFGGRKGAKGGGFKSEWIEQFHKNKDEYLAKDGSIPNRKTGFVPVEAKGKKLVKIETVSRYTPEILKANPDKVYLFGDNLEKVGRGPGAGQAIIRDEPNAYGIPTKKSPRLFMTDKEYDANVKAIDKAFASIPKDKTIVLPKDGLGTGRAQLKNKAPKTWSYLQKKLNELKKTIKKEFKEGKITYEEYLTTQDSLKDTKIDPDARDSKVWQYDSGWRQEISERAVDGRNLLGGTVSMAQILKASHNSLLALPNKSQTFTTRIKVKGKFIPVKITLKAKTSEKDLKDARQLASSMIAFTSDPLDVAGLKGYDNYYRKLSNAYFDIKVDSKVKLTEKQINQALKGKDGIIGQMTDINSALYSRDFINNRSWDAQSIKEKTLSTTLDSGLGLDKAQNTMLPKLGKLASSIELYDSPFKNINLPHLRQMYDEHNNLVDKLPEFKQLLNNLSVPRNELLFKIAETKLWEKANIDKYSHKTKLKTFNAIINSEGSPFAKGRGWYDRFIKGKENLIEKNRELRKDYLKELVKFSEDMLTQDVSDMISFRQVYRYYDAAEVGPVVFNKMLRKVSQLRRNSYLQRKNLDESYEEVAEGVQVPKSTAEMLRKSFGELTVESKEKATTLDQSTIDAEIANFKRTLPNDRSKKLFDMLMLGSFRDGTSETSISKLGLSSQAVDKASVVDFVGDYSTIMNKAYEKIPVKKSIVENLEKGDMVEKDLPENTILRDTTTGYEGLHGKLTGKQIPKEVKQELTELVENLKFYNGKIGQNLNEVVRGILGKDFNTLQYKDFVDLNNYFKELQRGTIFQRMFGDKSPTLKKRYTMLFPATIGRETMKYDIELLKKRGLFLTKASEVVEGDMLIPSNFTEKLQHAVSLSMDKAQGKGDEEVGRLRKTLEFLDSLEDGEALRRVAVRKIESDGNSGKTLHSDKALAKKWAENYLKEYHNEMEAVDYNTLKDNKYRINEIIDGKTTRLELTGEQIVSKVEDVYKNHFKNMYKLIRGNPELLESYIQVKYGKKQYFDFKGAKNEPIYDYKRFVKDIYKAYERGEDITTEFGVDGLRAMARSMMMQLQHKYKKMSRSELRKLIEVPEPTREMTEGYWPHMFFDKVLAKKSLESAIKTIENSSMSQAEKSREIEKIMWRSKTLTGDWITGTENWETFDRHNDPVNTQKKSDKVSWFNANQMTSSMHSRTSHIPGWSVDATVAETYSRNVYKTYYKQLAQILSRDILQEFDTRAINKGWHKTDVSYETGQRRSLMDRWSDHYKLYVQDAMGHPSIIPDYMINDPGMKLKGTPYAWWADNKVTERVNDIGKKLGLKQPVVNKILRDKWSVEDIRHWSNLEAKFELMSLLAHPKSAINNLFGGSLHTIQSSGATALKKVYDYNFLRTINPKWTNRQALKDFVIRQGIFPEMLQHEWGLQKEFQSAKAKEFLKDVGKKLNPEGGIEKTSLRELADKHKVAAPIMNAAAKFMSIPEMKLRTDAFMSHYIKAWERFGGAITQHDHPFLIEQAKKGVKATQFLYNAPFRPGFARTALGKIMTRFQLWGWNAHRFRNDVIREARIRGYRQGTPEYEKFKRTAQIDLLTYSLASVFAMSIFENVLPAPLNHLKESAEWLFGDEKERNKAFWGKSSVWPLALRPLQIITPPISRVATPLKALVNDDYDKFLNYHIYTMFPFGRIARDVSPWAKGNVLDNPYRIVEKFTGLPYGDLQRQRRKYKDEEAYHPVYRSMLEDS